jgi:hypothetical protein
VPVRSDKRWNYRFHRRPVASSGSREVFAVRLLSDRKLLLAEGKDIAAPSDLLVAAAPSLVVDLE